MDEKTINTLITMGFSYEDLYKKGILVIKPAEAQGQPTEPTEPAEPAESTETQGQPAEAQGQPAEPTEAQGQPTEAQGQPAQSTEFVKLWKSFDAFKDEIKLMLAQFNTQNATRQGNEQNKMTIDDAIIGLSKGG